MAAKSRLSVADDVGRASEVLRASTVLLTTSASAVGGLLVSSVML